VHVPTYRSPLFSLVLPSITLSYPRYLYYTITALRSPVRPVIQLPEYYRYSGILDCMVGTFPGYQSHTLSLFPPCFPVGSYPIEVSTIYSRCPGYRGVSSGVSKALLSFPDANPHSTGLTDPWGVQLTSSKYCTASWTTRIPVGGGLLGTGGRRGYRARGPIELYATPLELGHYQHPPCQILYRQVPRGRMPIGNRLP
jgi:hypothetical protein